MIARLFGATLAVVCFAVVLPPLAYSQARQAPPAPGEYWGWQHNVGSVKITVGRTQRVPRAIIRRGRDHDGNLLRKRLKPGTRAPRITLRWFYRRGCTPVYGSGEDGAPTTSSDRLFIARDGSFWVDRRGGRLAGTRAKGRFKPDGTFTFRVHDARCGFTVSGKRGPIDAYTVGNWRSGGTNGLNFRFEVFFFGAYFELGGINGRAQTNCGDIGFSGNAYRGVEIAGDGSFSGETRADGPPPPPGGQPSPPGNPVRITGRFASRDRVEGTIAGTVARADGTSCDWGPYAFSGMPGP